MVTIPLNSNPTVGRKKWKNKRVLLGKRRGKSNTRLQL
jgi:hypothetical protein